MDSFPVKKNQKRKKSQIFGKFQFFFFFGDEKPHSREFEIFHVCMSEDSCICSQVWRLLLGKERRKHTLATNWWPNMNILLWRCIVEWSIWNCRFRALRWILHKKEKNLIISHLQLHDRKLNIRREYMHKKHSNIHIMVFRQFMWCKENKYNDWSWGHARRPQFISKRESRKTKL